MAIPNTHSMLFFCIFILLTLILQHSAESKTHEPPSLFLHRKVFLEKKETGYVISGMPENGSYGHNTEMPDQEDWELRRVPAGPDPLHHNGQDPQKPRTP